MLELFDPYYYYPAHLIIVSLLTFVYIFYLRRNSDAVSILNNNHTQLFVIIYILVFIIVAGLRPISGAFGDTRAYSITYSYFQISPIEIIGAKDPFFYLFMWLCAQRISFSSFLLIIEALYVIAIYISCYRLARNNADIMMLFCLAAFSFFSYGVNGIRNGVACSFALLAISFLRGKGIDKVLCILFSLIAFNTHHSTALPLLCMVIASIGWKRYYLFFYFWLFSIAISLVVGQSVSSFFANLGFDDRLSDYILHEADEERFSRAGFRWDFLLYSSLPIVFGYYVLVKKKTYDRNYLLLLETYILSNSFWIMVIRASYSNRFAYLSWFLYPIVLSYPLLKLNIWPRSQGLKTSFIMVAHLAFTLFMVFIYG